MGIPLIEALNVRAIHAYEVEDDSALPGLRRFGAVMALHGIAMNGGGIENLFFNDRMHAVDDAVEGLQWFVGPDDMRAALIYQRATSEADKRIADRMSALVDGQEVRWDRADDDDGVAGALVPAR